MSLEINKLYYSLYKKERPLVSVIIPTKDHPESFVESLVGALQQDYPKMEILVADSGDTSVEKIIIEAQKSSPIPIRYIRFNRRGTYSLAEARNRAVIEADGEWLVLCDDRIKMDKDAVSMFELYKGEKCWLWGSKDGAFKGFVENFSFVNRRDLIDKGMFCERMQWYGGMTQELRERFEKRNSFNFAIVNEAKAYSVGRAKSKVSRREDIIEAKFLLYKMYGK